MELTVDIAGLMIEELQARGLSDISLTRVDSKSWLATLEGKTPILVEWTNDPGRLVLSSVLGRPTAEQRTAVFETLLSYNLLWEETGGARMAINGAEGKAVLIYDLHGNNLTYVLLGTVLTNFSQLVEMWRDYVRHEAPVATPAAMSSEMLYGRA